MSLRTRYTEEDDIVSLSTAENGGDSYDVESDCWTIVDVPFDDGYRPVALELMFVSRLIPLTTNSGYSSDTDTLIIGMGADTAGRTEENGDLTAYWCRDGDDPEDWSLVAVSLRNASKYLAPVVAKPAG